MSQQIAQVPTAVMVDGVRTIIAPGRPIPAASDAAPAEPATASPAPVPKTEVKPEIQNGPGEKPSLEATAA